MACTSTSTVEGREHNHQMHCCQHGPGETIKSGPKEGLGGYVAPAFSGVPNTKRGEKIRIGCLNSACSVIPNAKHGEQSQKWSPTKGNKITRGCLTRAFLGGQKRVEMLRHPCILKGPQRQAWEQNQKGLPHPCLLGGPKEGGNAASPLHSQGSPTPSTGSKIRSGPQQRGTKSEVAASTLM